MKIFITGGTGFIGSHAVKSLLAEKHQVTVYSRNPCGIPAFSCNPNFHFVQGEIADRAKLSAALVGHEACIHLVLGWGDSPTEMLANDTLCSVALFELAVAAGIQHIVYSSTVSAFGELRARMGVDSALRPQDLYGATKAATEAYLQAIAHQHAIRATIVRPCYTFGNPAETGGKTQPDQRISTLIDLAQRHADISLIKADGTQMYPVESLAALLVRLIEMPTPPSLVIAGTERYIQWTEVVQMILEKTGSRSKVIAQDLGWQPGACVYDCSTAQEILGAVPDVSRYLAQHIDYLIQKQRTL